MAAAVRQIRSRRQVPNFLGVKRILLLVAVLFLALTPPASASSGDEIDRFVRDYLEHTGLPGAAVAVTHGADVVRVAGYGHDSSDATLTSSTRMPIASLSKSMTAFAVLRLAEDGRLNLDDPVVRHLPEFRLADPRGARITVRMLLEQTSGMADSAFPDLVRPQPGTLAAAVARLADAPLADEPGTKFHYHNPNYEVAARLVEVVAGTPFADYLRTNVFGPLGMSSSSTVDTPAGAHGYVRAFGIPVAVDEPDWFVNGSHGVLTTAEDMARWLIAQGGSPVLSPASLTLAHTPAPGRDYALGWATWTPGQVSHSGQWFSYTAAQILLPGGWGVAVLADTGMALENDADVLARGLVELVRGGHPEPARPAGVVADWVLAGLIALSLVLGVLGVVRSRRWAARRSSWRAVLRLVPCLLPLVVLVALPELMGVVYAGREGTFWQVLYVWPAVVIWLAIASACGLAVVVTRTVRWQAAAGTRRIDGGRGESKWDSEEPQSGG